MCYFVIVGVYKLEIKILDVKINNLFFGFLIDG